MVDETTKQDPWAVEAAADEPQFKRGIPGWVWGCGGGCLVTLAAFIGLTLWMVSKVMKEMGPEAAWPVVAEILPYGPEEPGGYVPTLIDTTALADNWLMRAVVKEQDISEEERAKVFGHQIVMLQEDFDLGKGDNDKSMAILWRLPTGGDPDGAELPRGFETGNSEPESEPEKLTMTLQGRDLEATLTRWDSKSTQLGPAGAQTILALDLTGDRERPLMLKFITTGNIKADEAELQRFFEPFDVWGGQ